MIDIINGRLIYGNTDEKIIRWEVRWKTPLGMFRTTDEAVEAMKKFDIDPIVCITPICVAVSDSLTEPWIR